MTEELGDPVDDGTWDHITLGSATSEDLGHATVRVLTKKGSKGGGTYDSVTITDIGATTFAICKRAVKKDEDRVLLPSNVIPMDRVDTIAPDLSDEALEAAGAELIGVDPRHD